MFLNQVSDSFLLFENRTNVVAVYYNEALLNLRQL